MSVSAASKGGRIKSEQQPASERSLRWLFGQARSALPWVGLTVGLGLGGGLLLIVQAWCVARIVHGAAIDGLMRDRLVPFFLILVAAALAKALLAWGRELAGFQAGASIRAQVRRALLTHIGRLGPIYTAAQKSGAVTSTLMEQVEALHGFFALYLPQLVLAAAIPAAILAFVFPISWAAGGLLLITAPMIPLFMALIGMGAHSISQRYFAALSRLSAHFLDALQGLPTLRLFHRSRAEEEQVGTVSAAYRRQTMKVLRVAFLSAAVLEFFSSIAIALTAVYLGMSFLGYYHFGAWGQPLTLAGGLFIIMLAPDFYLPLRELGTHYHTRAEAMGAASEILKILKTPLPAEVQGPRELDTAGGIDLRFVDVHVSYQDDRRPAVNGVSLLVKSGCRLTVVGESGAGKTSLLHLALGFVSPKQGDVQVNGVSLGDLDMDAWRRHVAWVGQDPTVFHGTLRDNIRMGRPQADPDEIRAAACAARVLDFAAQLPEGMDTLVGERGYGLSRGQAQRVALARAFIKDAPLLLLDEPTAGLDPANERFVMQALEALCRGRTVLLSTHRLTGIERAGQIVVMAGGKVAEAGTHAELLAAGGAYRRLATSVGGADAPAAT